MSALEDKIEILSLAMSAISDPYRRITVPMYEKGTLSQAELRGCTRGSSPYVMTIPTGRGNIRAVAEWRRINYAGAHVDLHIGVRPYGKGKFRYRIFPITSSAMTCVKAFQALAFIDREFTDAESQRKNSEK